MAKINIQWARTDLISVSDEAREMGFDIRKFDRQDDEVQASVRKASIDRVMRKVRLAWDETQEGRKARASARSATASMSFRSATGVRALSLEDAAKRARPVRLSQTVP